MTQAEVNTPDEFDTWMAERPKWLQTAAAKLLQGQRPDNAFIQAMADLCLAEVSKQADATYDTMPLGAFTQPPAAFKMRLDKISGVRGLNAIKAGAELALGAGNLTIIYGTNGVGKSGFARLLKHACGSRHRADLLPNVFDAASPAPSAEFAFDWNGGKQSLAWKAGDAPLKPLRHIHIFDTSTATEYVTSKNEASYETRRLRFISSLIQVCDDVTSNLSERANKLVSAIPATPTDLEESKASSFIAGLTHKTTQDHIDQSCKFSAKDKEARIALESTLSETNIEGKLTALRTQIKQLEALQATLDSLKNGYSSEKLEQFLQSRKEAEEKRTAANDAATKAFSSAPLDGIGTPSWRELWKYARQYSEKVAYKDKAFPVVEPGSHCVLCQQPFSEEAKTRMESFEDFIKGAMEADAHQSESKCKELREAFPDIPTVANWSTLLLPLNLEDSVISECHMELSAAQSYLSTLTPDVKPKCPTLLPAYLALASFIGNAKTQEDALKASQDAEQRAAMETQLKSLKSIEWLSSQKASIEAEVSRLKNVSLLQSAAKLAKTNALTSKKGELLESELSKGYQDRFSEELTLLGGNRIPVEPAPIPQGKGKISFQVRLKGAARQEQAHKILSEGENRIVALAAFLADMRGLGFATPFVFDDPISSLDQDYEERVVARLTDLAKDRQVIVFTHRLSLVTLLQDAMSEQGPSEPHIESLLRIGKHLGVSDKLRIRHLKPQTGFSHMQQAIAGLKKLEDKGDIESLETKLNAACTDFRIQLEKAVETCLLSEIVLRFRRSLQTTGRLERLLVITPVDIKLIEDMMTKYSIYEHSQSDELAAKSIDLDELSDDIQKMIVWMADIKKRKVPQASPATT